MQRITVASVTSEKGKKPPYKPYYILTDTNGTKMSTFDSAVLSLVPGTVIDIEVAVEGKFTNLLKWTVVSAPPANAPPTAPPSNGNGHRSPDTQASIERQCCLKCAVETTLGRNTEYTQVTQEFLTEILLVAEGFYRWVSRGDIEVSNRLPGQEASGSFDGIPSVTAKAPPRSDPKTPADFETWCKDLGLTYKDIYAKTHIAYKDAIKDIGSTVADIKAKFPEKFRKEELEQR